MVEIPKVVGHKQQYLITKLSYMLQFLNIIRFFSYIFFNVILTSF